MITLLNPATGERAEIYNLPGGNVLLGPEDFLAINIGSSLAEYHPDIARRAELPTEEAYRRIEERLRNEGRPVVTPDELLLCLRTECFAEYERLRMEEAS